MSGPIESEYFDWLCAKVLPPNTQNYNALMRILYTRAFTWTVFGDRNRSEDGIELRQYFITETGWFKDPLWFDEPCSFLEFFIAFATRAAFQTDISMHDWFWTFISNLGLEEYRHISSSDLPEIERVLYTFVWRRFDRRGRGGIFPLDHADNDQREVEYWYQFSEYVTDRGLL